MASYSTTIKKNAYDGYFNEEVVVDFNLRVDVVVVGLLVIIEFVGWNWSEWAIEVEVIIIKCGLIFMAFHTMKHSFSSWFMGSWTHLSAW